MTALISERDPWLEPSRRLARSSPFEQLREGARWVHGLPVTAAGWVCGLLARERRRPLLAIVPRESDALAWLETAQLTIPEATALYFPSPPLTPYQETEASLLVRSQEAVALDAMRTTDQPWVVCTPRALFRRLPPRASFARATLEIVAGQEQPPEALASHLVRYGYRRSELVADVGVFAVRGGVFDLYPPGEPRPVRLDLFGDVVESLRRFDPVSQRSAEELERLRVLPMSLVPAGLEQAEELAELLRERAGARDGTEAAERIAALERGETFPGWENYLPALGPEAKGGESTDLASLLEGALVVAVEPELLRQEAKHHREVLESDFRGRREQGRLSLPPSELTLELHQVQAVIDGAELCLGEPLDGGASVSFGAIETERLVGQFPRFPREVAIARERGERVFLVSPGAHHQRLGEVLRGRDLTIGPDGVELIAGELRRGFRLPAAGVSVWGEEQLFPSRGRVLASERLRPFLSGLRDLKVGEYVVHEDHGIGQYTGMRSLERSTAGADLPPALAGMAEVDASPLEVMEITYSDGRTLLLPLDRLDQIQRYSGIEGATPRLDRLGGSSWAKKKSRVRRSLQKLAVDLLKLYAERELARAPAALPDSDGLHQFEAAFEYDETDDQLAAARSIKEDLEKTRPMDRLLVGDVGFGKTEVAMRAAFKMVESGYQVAVLAPTTILADQHLQTFRERFSGFPVNVEMISRFRSPAEVREIRERLERGQVDILIGTHRLLGRDIELPRLGLLVVDEEQRFGVGQKEKLKELRKNVHVLAMSATPVPRTLQLSLAGVRDLSTIESPPKDRMAVETKILPFSEELVREVIDFERERGGQIYYVYNRVEDIERIAAFLRELVPDLRLTVGHGQLDEAELARRMREFKAGEMDLLLATTIIENGIDIPNVNTMIVHRADRFGLAQLYQLRGRVGRSDQLAFCYLLVPPDTILTEVARRRLLAIREFSELGAGFRVAARDLEIRGAGNLLGAEQSGHIAELGIETYLKMLEDCVRELRGETTEAAPSAHLDLPVVATIPKEYVAETNLRMEIYRRFAAGDESGERIVDELRDRFGPPPESVATLARLADLKRLAERLRVQSIRAKKSSLVFQLRRDARIDVEVLIGLVSEREDASFSPDGVLTLGGVPPGESLSVALETLAAISRDPASPGVPEGAPS
ncbi:MAG TPA: transcription-repair coupling factor [Thermoanaerobaculia bacterium]|nr:transcription-repair coupling factor [Thermoanaerobaculia bacterium]